MHFNSDIISAVMKEELSRVQAGMPRNSFHIVMSKESFTECIKTAAGAYGVPEIDWERQRLLGPGLVGTVFGRRIVCYYGVALGWLELVDSLTGELLNTMKIFHE